MGERNWHIRHETGCDNLESQGEPGQEARQIAGDASAHGQEASEEGAHGKEQPNDDEGEHEPRHQEVVLGARLIRLAQAHRRCFRGNILDELIRNILSRVEVTVAWGIEGEVRVRFPAVILPASSDPAEVPECPARERRCAGYIPGVGLEEVDLIERRGVATTGQKSQENQQDGACHKEQAHKAQRRS